MANPANAGEGFLSTRGNQIIDSDGRSVQLSGTSWFGMETSRFLPDGLHVRGYKSMLDQMKDLGFNSLRVPISNEFLDPASRTGYFDPYRNVDLVGLKPLEVLDKIVAYAGEIGIKIILDHHRSNGSENGGAQENGLWFTSTYTEERWISDWKFLAQHYAGNDTVIGAELHNEPFNGVWGGGGSNDWAAAAERAGNAIHSVNGDWLIFVEGVRTYQGRSYWDGGNLMGVKDRPITLTAPDKLVYTVHDYPASVYNQPWFNEPGYPANLTAKFREAWGYIFEQNIAPVWVSEFGSRLQNDQPKDLQWFKAITAYLSGDFNADGVRDLAAGLEGISWNWWSWNPNSYDTGGILKDDWSSVHYDKVSQLDAIMGDPIGSPEPGMNLIQGTQGADTLVGTRADDRILGLAGDDVLYGGLGNDHIDGGAGADTALFAGLRREYAVTGDALSRSVISAQEGTDTLKDVEALSFADGRLVFDIFDRAAVTFRLYDTAFDRAPDGVGLNFWISSIEGGWNLKDVASFFAASVEFQATYGSLSNEGFVRQLYRNVLDREGEAQGVSFWTGELDGGRLSRGEVLLGFSESTEHVELLRPAVERGIWDLDTTAARVARIYSAGLDRQPDAEGLAFWVDAVKRGTHTADSAAQFFVSSPEFTAKYGNLSNTAFVDQLYLNILDRPGEAEGTSFWTNVLDNGTMDRADVLLGFSESLENQTRTQVWMDDGILFV